jgi:hypothetical protein
VSLGIEHELVDSIVVDLEDIILEGTISGNFKLDLGVGSYRCVDEVAVLHHLREQETVLEVVEAAAASDIHVLQLGESRTGAGGAIDGDERVPGPVLVLGVTSGSVGVVETLNNLRAEDVCRISNVETGLLIECQLVCWGLGVIGVVGASSGGDPSELFRSDSSGVLGVGILAAVHEC